MILGKEKRKKEKAITNGELIKFLKNYPEDDLIMFQDFNFSSGKKETVKDVIIRKEEYPFNNNEKGETIILINEFLNLNKINNNPDGDGDE